MELEEHYGRLLGVNSPWEICHIELKVEDQRLDIWIEYTDDEGSRPECGELAQDTTHARNAAGAI